MPALLYPPTLGQLPKSCLGCSGHRKHRMVTNTQCQQSSRETQAPAVHTCKAELSPLMGSSDAHEPQKCSRQQDQNEGWSKQQMCHGQHWEGWLLPGTGGMKHNSPCLNRTRPNRHLLCPEHLGQVALSDLEGGKEIPALFATEASVSRRVQAHSTGSCHPCAALNQREQGKYQHKMDKPMSCRVAKTRGVVVFCFVLSF